MVALVVPLNTSDPLLGALPWKWTLVRLVQTTNALSPILVTLSGIVMLVRLGQE